MRTIISALLLSFAVLPSQSRAAETSTLEAVKAAGQSGFAFLGINGLRKKAQNVPAVKPAPVRSPARPPATALPTGRYVNANGGPERFLINEFGRLTTNIQVRLGTGHAGDIVFPQMLRYDGLNDRYTGTGSFSIDYWTNRGVLRCTWPIKLQLAFSPDGRAADMTLIGNQLNYLDVFGGCQAIGQATYAFGFNKDDNWGAASASAFTEKAVLQQKK